MSQLPVAASDAGSRGAVSGFHNGWSAESRPAACVPLGWLWSLRRTRMLLHEKRGSGSAGSRECSGWARRMLPSSFMKVCCRSAG